MKSLMSLLKFMLEDMSMRCGTDTQPDYDYVVRRVENEGLSFLTITLPRFCRDFERSLDQKRVDRVMFLGFKRLRKHPGIPSFLRGILGQIFDTVTGELLNAPSIPAIYAVRQTCLVFKKIQLPCTSQRIEAAYDAYVKTDQNLPERESVAFRTRSILHQVSTILWGDVIPDVERSIVDYRLIPRHGPGATADRISGNKKYELKQWHERLQHVFPLDMYGFSSPAHLLDACEETKLEMVAPDQELPVRVITVPKTMSTPRIIAIEPVCMQYIQQAMMAELVTQLSMSEYGMRINFADQTINRNAALMNSKSTIMATMDLSEASDRVALWLVEDIFASFPIFLEAIKACRSTRANVPGFDVFELKKFASMGSALCFPIESMVFFTLLVARGFIEHNRPVRRREIEEISRLFLVYGDDLIVPADHVPAISEFLESFGLKVNLAKTFAKGNFRESCGMDAYDGHDVTPCYLRRVPPSNRHDVNELISYVSFANHLYEKGCWRTAEYVRAQVESILGKLPVVRKTAPCLGWHTLSGGYDIQGWTDVSKSEPKVRSWKLVPKYEASILDGYPALMKCLLPRGKPFEDAKHLERSVRSGSVRIIRRWTRPF